VSSRFCETPEGFLSWLNNLRGQASHLFHRLANDWIGRVIDALTLAPYRRLTTKAGRYAIMTGYRRGVAVFDRQAFLTPATEK
jgi:hypothetical protein